MNWESDRVFNRRWSMASFTIAACGAWSSSASATLTVWTDQAAWMAAVQPGWSIDFPTGPLMQISADHFASSGIQLGEYFNPPSANLNFFVGTVSLGGPWEPRGVLTTSFTTPSLKFAQTVSALGVIVATGNIQPMWIRYADGTTQFVQLGQVTPGWNFFGFTSTVPIIGFSQYNTEFDQLWLSNPVPTPGVLALLALAAPVSRHRRRV